MMCCEHPEEVHQHYRAGTECALCECPGYRWDCKCRLCRKAAKVRVALIMAAVVLGLVVLVLALG